MPAFPPRLGHFEGSALSEQATGRQTVTDLRLASQARCLLAVLVAYRAGRREGEPDLTDASRYSAVVAWAHRTGQLPPRQ